MRVQTARCDRSTFNLHGAMYMETTDSITYILLARTAVRPSGLIDGQLRRLFSENVKLGPPVVDMHAFSVVHVGHSVSQANTSVLFHSMNREFSSISNSKLQIPARPVSDTTIIKFNLNFKHIF